MFDFGCTQDGGTHVPNLCVAEMVCTNCVDQPPEYNCSACKSRTIFRGEETQSEFCEWLFQHLDTDNSVSIVHNAKDYGSYFLLEFPFENTCISSIIYNGAKLMCIDIPQHRQRDTDSTNFLSMALSKFPDTFGLTESKNKVSALTLEREELHEWHIQGTEKGES